MTPEERAAGRSTVDLGEWQDPLDDSMDKISWREVAGLLLIVGVVVLALGVSGGAVWVLS